MLNTSTRIRATAFAILILLSVFAVGEEPGRATTLGNGQTFPYASGCLTSDNGLHSLCHHTAYSSPAWYFLRSSTVWGCPGWYWNWTSAFEGSDSSYCGGLGLGSHSNQGSVGDSGNWLAMQQDGNLVLNNGSNQPIWATGTNGYGSSVFLAIQDDGNLVLIYNGTTPIWSIF